MLLATLWTLGGRTESAATVFPDENLIGLNELINRERDRTKVERLVNYDFMRQSYHSHPLPHSAAARRIQQSTFSTRGASLRG